MSQYIDAVWEDGVFRPLGPIDLPESQIVSLTIVDEPVSPIDESILELARKESAKCSVVPSIEEVRDALACIPDSMAEFVVAERGE